MQQGARAGSPGPAAAARAGSSSLLHASLIVLAAVAVGAGTLGHGLVFDDHALIGGNAPVIAGQKPLLSAFTYRYWGATDEAAPNELYRPVTIVSLALNVKALGPDPLGLHAVNVLLHAINGVLVYLLVGRLFARRALSLLAGLLFVVHPIATEAVAAVAGRADLLATFFLLSACLLALAASRHRRAWIVAGGLGVALATFLGALSKESVFAAPLVTIAVLGSDAWRHRGPKRADREYLLTAATFAGIQAFVLLMAVLLRVQILGYLYRVEPPSSPSLAYLAFVNNPLITAEPMGRILTALRVAVMGAGLLVFPRRLSADYSFAQIPVTAGAPGAADWGALAFALIYLGLVFFSVRRFPVAFFGLCWSALTYLIVSNLLFPIGTIFGERLLYLPSIGFAILTAAGIERLGRMPGRRRAAGWALGVALVGLCAGRSIARSRDWADDERLFRAAVEASPASAKARSNYGFTLQRAGRCDEAAPHYESALQIAPGLTGSGINLARCLMELGRADEAVRRYRQVIEVDSGIAVAWSGLGLALEAGEEVAEAEKAFRRALELSLGRLAEAAAGLARVMAVTRRESEAVDMLRRLLDGSPGDASLRADLAQAHYLLGVRRAGEERPDEFLAQMRLAVELDPEHGPARYNLALEALQRGRLPEAREHARAGLRGGYRFPEGFLEACGLPALPGLLK